MLPSQRLYFFLHKLVVSYIVGRKILHVCLVVYKLVHLLYMNVLEPYGIDRQKSRALYVVDGICLLALNILHRDVADACRTLLVCRHDIFPLVQHIGINLESAAHTVCLHVLHANVFEESAVVGIELSRKQR